MTVPPNQPSPPHHQHLADIRDSAMEIGCILHRALCSSPGDCRNLNDLWEKLLPELVELEIEIYCCHDDLGKSR